MTRIRCSITVSGPGVQPSEISRRTGLLPSNTWRQGDAVQKTEVRRKANGWQFSLDEHSEALEGVLGKLVNKIKPSYEKLEAIIRETGAHVELGCAIHLDGEHAPSIHLDSEVLNVMRGLGAELDIDLYL